MKRYDSLTGLLDRQSFFEEAEALLSSNPDRQYDIVISDFVNFRYFNVRFGVAAGDLLLSKTGSMLSSLGPDCICGRYGADQFISIVEHLNDLGVTYLQNFHLPEQARNELPVDSVIVKFGICANIDRSRPINDFCDRALIAVQNIKHVYGKNVEIYNEFQDEEVKKLLHIEENMENALHLKQFKVYYQPKFDIDTEEIVGAEALVRWEHPKYGIIGPASFLDVFEHTGFITNLDEYVWDAVCRNLSKRTAANKKNVPVSVNMSRMDFNHGSPVETVIKLADKYGMAHDLLHIEITESAYVDQPGRVLVGLRVLHEHGFMVELDDFGLGYSSLSFLSNAKVDILKIDRSLLTGSCTGEGKKVLAFAYQLADMLNLQTIQEGIETREQIGQLKQLGCKTVQGFLYSKPLPEDKYNRFLDTYSPHKSII